MKVKYPLIKAMIFFTFNYSDYREVIHWIAEHQHTCNEDHLRAKWMHYANTYSSAEAWLRFYTDCNEDIREAMVDYIVQVYAPKSKGFDDKELTAMNTAGF